MNRRKRFGCAMRCVSGEVSASDGDGGYGGGFGSEDARAQGYGLPLVLGEEGDFFGGPAAFGADGYGVGDLSVWSDGLITRRSSRVCEDCG